MKNFNRALVALDLTDMDQAILTYVKNLFELFETEKTYFVHIVPDFSVPQNLDAEFHHLFSSKYPVDEKIKSKLALDIQDHFSEESRYEVDVREGKPYEKLLHWAQVKEIDLLVVGYKKESTGSGITAKRVARNANSHILFVPESPQWPLKHILVPIDFSDHSLKALKAALALKDEIPELNIQVLYVVDLPPADAYVSPKVTGYRALLVESAEKAFVKYCKEHDINQDEIRVAFVPNQLHNTARHILDYAANNTVDLILMGAQGHGMLERFIFGSVTERLVQKNLGKPILIMR